MIRKRTFEETLRSKMTSLTDHTLIARAMVSRIARWERGQFEEGGELCMGGFRYYTRLDPDGIPILNDHTRHVLESLMTAS